MPFYLSFLARAHAELGKFDDAWRCISEAMTTVENTKETWFEADINRIAGDIALMSPHPDAAKAEAYFERALAVPRSQQAKSDTQSASAAAGTLSGPLILASQSPNIAAGKVFDGGKSHARCVSHVLRAFRSIRG